MDKTRGCHELHPLTPAAERHGHMGAAVGGEQGKGTPLKTTGMKTAEASCGAAKQVRDSQAANRHDKNLCSLVFCLQTVE